MQTFALPLGHATKTGVIFRSLWSGRRGSNSLPPPWQGGALPDELRPHMRCICPCTLPFRRTASPKQGRGRKPKFSVKATRIGLEPTTPSVTGWCSNQLSYRAISGTGTPAPLWSGRRGSNSLPPPWQGGALPDELRPHMRKTFSDFRFVVPPIGIEPMTRGFSVPCSTY